MTRYQKGLRTLQGFVTFTDNMEGSRCFLLSIWSSELQPNSIHDKKITTTIQRSGRTSRYVIIPKKVCYKYGWGTGTELVIGLDYDMDEYVHGTIYKDDDFVPVEGKQPQACVIKFQRYQDMKKLYQKKLAKKKEDLARQESDAYWNTRNRPSYYDVIMDRIGYERKHVHKLVWNRLFQMNLVAVSYTDFVKLRATMEREKKKKRKQFLQKRYGSRATWRYRRDLVRYGKRHGYDYDARMENMLDDPDAYRENMLDDPQTYGKNEMNNADGYNEDELDNQD
ncbi:hypothetical protein DYY67_2006 [Candidatus Nitrosotalea sp. TS]|nr:hypothetical protein [Candidatus Nitrosotalea sp. TS]